MNRLINHTIDGGYAYIIGWGTAYTLPSAYKIFEKKNYNNNIILIFKPNSKFKNINKLNRNHLPLAGMLEMKHH